MTAGSHLLNPLPVVRWNTQKRRYLPDLAMDGLPSIPTYWLAKRSSANLDQILSTLGWNRTVLKPSIAANAYGTCVAERRKRESVARGQQHLDHFLRRQDMVVQPYLASMERFGERSHVFINGSWSHAFARMPFHTLTSEELRGSFPHTRVWRNGHPLSSCRTVQQQMLLSTHSVHDTSCLVDTSTVPGIYARSGSPTE